MAPYHQAIVWNKADLSPIQSERQVNVEMKFK